MFTAIVRSVFVSVLWVQWAAGKCSLPELPLSACGCYCPVHKQSLVDPYHMSGSDGMSGFPAESAVTARAAQLHRLVPHPSELSVYPDMTFDCSGNVTAVRMLVHYSGTSATSINLVGLHLRLLRPGPAPVDPGDSDEDDDGRAGGAAGSSLSGTAADIDCLQYHQLHMFRLQTLQPELGSSSGTVQLLQFQLEPPVGVMAGDILGVGQGEEDEGLLYQEGGGPRRFTTSNDGRMCYRPVNNEASQDYPLIAIDFETTGMNLALQCTYTNALWCVCVCVRQIGRESV